MTERDLELVRCISRFGFLTVDQVVQLWGSADFSTVAARVRKLIEAGLIWRLELRHLSARPLLATRYGSKLAGDLLPPLTGIRLGTFEHDHTLFNLAMALEARHSGRFETEREYRFRRCERTVDFHVPDGVLHHGGQRIGIEYELTQKAPRRLAEIINSHCANLELDEIWYVVRTEQMRAYVRRVAGQSSPVKIVLWSARKAPSNHSVSLP